MAHQIQPPPPWKATFGAAFIKREEHPSAELEAALEAADTTKGYLHWDQFRYRPTPADWSPLELWSLVRGRRASVARPFPLLQQKSGTPFTLCVSAPMNAALHRIDTKEVLWSRALAPGVPGLDDDVYRLMAAIEEAHHSSVIEGAVTTRRESQELLRSGREPRSRSERMVLNNFRALERLNEWCDSPLTPELVCEIQSTVTDGTLEDPRDQGVVRVDDDVRILDAATGEVVFQPPSAKELPTRLEAMCRFANDKPRDEDFLSPVTRAILLHHQLAYDHPFADGNGRTARTLFLWSMLRSGYAWLRALSISRAVHLDKARYYKSFRFVQLDDGDVTYFVRHQLCCLEREVERLAEFLEQRVQLSRKIERRAKLKKELNARQLALVGHALEHEASVYTVREHQLYHGVSQPTAWKDLQALTQVGLLAEERRGRRSLYRPTEQLLKLREVYPEA